MRRQPGVSNLDGARRRDAGAFFQQLALSSRRISREMKLANIRWSEQQQRDGQFNSLICQALSNAAQR
jgi:hypothetical protein